MKMLIATATLTRHDLLNALYRPLALGLRGGDRLLVLDNGGQPIALPGRAVEIVRSGWNLGVPASWNYFLRRAFIEGDFDALMILGDDVRIGSAQVAAAKALLDRHGDVDLLLSYSFFDVQVHRRGNERTIGFYDERFSPAWCEDDDYARTMIQRGRIYQRFHELDPLPGSILSGTTKPQPWERARRTFAEKWPDDPQFGINQTSAPHFRTNRHMISPPGAGGQQARVRASSSAEAERAEVKLHVHVVCWNDMNILPWFMAHYEPFAARIFVHDNGSTDGTREYAIRCPTAELLDFDSGGEFREDLQVEVKNNAWKGLDADWVIAVDADEFLHSPGCDLLEAVQRFEAAGVAVPPTQGYHMIADGLPRYEPGALLHEHIRLGAADAEFSKRCLFDARRVVEINYAPGCHTCDPILRGDNRPAQPAPLPTLQLLHFKYAAGLPAVLERHARGARRMSSVNVRNGWNFHYADPAHTTRQFNHVRATATVVPGL